MTTSIAEAEVRIDPAIKAAAVGACRRNSRLTQLPDHFRPLARLIHEDGGSGVASVA